MASIGEEIRDSLRRLNSTLSKPGPSSREGLSSLRIAEGTFGADVARSALRSAIGAAPGSSDTLSSHVQLLAGQVGTDQAMVNQVVRLTGVVNSLRNAWSGLNQETRTSVINSAVGIAGTAAAANLAVNVWQGGRNVFQGLRDFPTNAVSNYYRNTGGGLVSRATRGYHESMVGFGQGQAIAGAGLLMNAAFGESYAGDALQVGGSAVSAYYGHRVLSSRRFMSGMHPALRTAGRIAGYAALAGEVYASLPRGHRDENSDAEIIGRGSGGDPDSVVRNQRSLGYANEYPVILAGLSRIWRGLANGNRPEMLQAATMAGILPEGTPGSELVNRRGNFLSNAGRAVGNLVGHVYGMSRNWTQEENEDVADIMGGRRPRTKDERRLSQISQSLPFQSRQFDVLDMHGVIQGEAVKTELEQQRLTQLIEEMQRLTTAIEAARNVGPLPNNPPRPS